MDGGGTGDSGGVFRPAFSSSVLLNSSTACSYRSLHPPSCQCSRKHFSSQNFPTSGHLKHTQGVLVLFRQSLQISIFRRGSAGSAPSTFATPGPSPLFELEYTLPICDAWLRA